MSAKDEAGGDEEDEEEDDEEEEAEAALFSPLSPLPFATFASLILEYEY